MADGVRREEFVYDAGNEILVIRSAIALACNDETEARTLFRSLVHSVGAEEFLVGQHGAIWRALRSISDGAHEYTPDIIRQMAVGDAVAVEDHYLAELESQAEVDPNLDYHVTTLRFDATRARVMREALPELVADLKDPRVTLEKTVTSARAVVRALEGGGGRRFIYRPEQSAAGYRAELLKRRESGNFWPCGFPEVDRLMSEGFMPGNCAILTGLSGSGKSTFAAKLALNFANVGRRVLVCAWEMGRYSTLDLMVSMITRLPLDAIIKGAYTDSEFRRIDAANVWINKRILFMENAFFGQVSSSTIKGERRSNNRNLDILEGYIAESGCNEVIMDLWDRLLADQSPDGVTDALYRQQNMCREYNFHGTLLVQLRLKDVEKRADKRPTRESIKGVGTFVEVADLIFGVHRDAQFKDVPDNALELICLKQRKGRSNWAVRFGWDGAYCAITGGEEIPYNPGLEAVAEYGELNEPASIRTRPRRRINQRD